eukprot:m.44054 g.44054  ORF g.44054 m.44054 type:complete len:386 (-) comp10583_c0_seq1:1226-2383(-)
MMVLNNLLLVVVVVTSVVVVCLCVEGAEGSLSSWVKNTITTAASKAKSKATDLFSTCPPFRKHDYTTIVEMLQTNKGIGDKCDLVPIIGQSVAVDIVASVLSRATERPDRIKPPVLLLFGPPGLGKTFMTRKIKQVLLRSRFMENEEKTFKRNHETINCNNLKGENDKYLLRAIAEQLRKCKHSIIVIEELQLLPKAQADQVRPIFDHPQHVLVDGLPVDASKALFLFTSNQDYKLLTKMTTSLLKSGKRRSELRIGDFENTLNKIESFPLSGYIDHWLAFMPATRNEIVEFMTTLIREDECRKDINILYSLEIVEHVVDKYVVFNRDYPLFSKNGFRLLEGVYATKIGNKVSATVKNQRGGSFRLELTARGNIECISLHDHDEM